MIIPFAAWGSIYGPPQLFRIFFGNIGPFPLKFSQHTPKVQRSKIPQFYTAKTKYSTENDTLKFGKFKKIIVDKITKWRVVKNIPGSHYSKFWML